MWFRRAFKRGGSVCVGLPKRVARAIGIEPGAWVEVEMTTEREARIRLVTREGRNEAARRAGR